MKSKLTALSETVLPILFWCLIWQISATFIDNQFLFPDIPSTFKALLALVCGERFYKAVLLSALRVTLGLLLGITAGTLLAMLCHRSKTLHALFSPLISVIKSTPVASFIVVLWVMMSGDALSVFIGFLMVMPIIWQNVLDGYSAIDKDLAEVADVYEFSHAKRVKFLIFPTLKSYLIPAIITASGLSWKAEIAAEIIAYTKNSIGQGINDAKYNMDTPTVFAWTLVIIVFSIILERGTKYLLGRVEK